MIKDHQFAVSFSFPEKVVITNKEAEVGGTTAL